MATAFVSGAAVLLKAHRPTFSPTAIRSALVLSADPVPGWSGKSVSGGRLNVDRMILTADTLSVPLLSGTQPASPANDSTPVVLGSVGLMGEPTLVKLYRGNGCPGAPVGTATPTAFNATGLEVSAPHGQVSAFSARSADASGRESACSSSISYIEADYRPDALVGVREDKLTGDQIHGLDGTDQTILKTVKQHSTKTFIVRLQNDEPNADDTVITHMSADLGRWRFHAYLEGVDVTHQVLSADGYAVQIPHGGSRDLVYALKPRIARVGSELFVLTTATSLGDVTSKDAVGIRLGVKA